MGNKWSRESGKSKVRHNFEWMSSRVKKEGASGGRSVEERKS